VRENSWGNKSRRGVQIITLFDREWLRFLSDLPGVLRGRRADPEHFGRQKFLSLRLAPILEHDSSLASLGGGKETQAKEKKNLVAFLSCCPGTCASGLPK